MGEGSIGERDRTRVVLRSVRNGRQRARVMPAHGAQRLVTGDAP
jgi:hypothetical protein